MTLEDVQLRTHSLPISGGGVSCGMYWVRSLLLAFDVGLSFTAVGLAMALFLAVETGDLALIDHLHR